MKILHIINSLETGGAEKLILDTLPILQNSSDNEVDLALLNANSAPFYDMLMKNNKGKVYELSEGSVYNPMLILKIIPLLKKYDVVHVHLFPSQYFVAIAKVLSFSNTKLVFTEHNTGNKRMDNPKYRLIEKFIYKQYSKVICITDQVKTELNRKIKVPFEKMFVINNGINVQEINKISANNRKLFGLNDEDKIVIMVAGFREQKDQDTVIRTMSKLPDEYKLILVGDGERRKFLENLVLENKLQNRVFLLGIRKDVISLIKMSDVAVLSSHWEGFGLAAAEAMACGVPTIASNVDGLSSVVENGGILFEKGNIDDLKNKILMLENDEVYKHYSKLGIEKAKQYDIKLMINKLQDLYKVL